MPFFAQGTGKIWRNKTQWLNSGVYEHTFLNRRRGTDCFIPLQLRGSRGRRVFLHFLCLLSWSLPPSFFLHNFLEALYTHILHRCRILKKNLTKRRSHCRITGQSDAKAIPVSLLLSAGFKNMIYFNIEDWPYDILQTPRSPKCLLLTLGILLDEREILHKVSL